MEKKEEKKEFVDISALVTQDNADEGVWVQAEVYGNKQPFEIKILGADNDEVMLHQKKVEREASKALGAVFGRGSVDEVETAEDIRSKAIENAVVRMNGLKSTDGKPLILQGVELGSDRDSYILLCRKIPAIIDFVVQKSNDRMLFMSGRKKD